MMASVKHRYTVGIVFVVNGTSLARVEARLILAIRGQSSRKHEAGCRQWVVRAGQRGELGQEGRTV